MRSEIEALIERVEKATEGCTQLDVDIYDQFGWPADYASDAGPTQSLDAAVALADRVLPGWSGDLDIGKPIAENGKVGARLFPLTSGFKNYAGEAATPALALVAATLRALSQKELRK